MLPYAFVFKGFSQESLDYLVKVVDKKLEGFEINSFSLGCSFLKTLSEEGIAQLRTHFQSPLIQAVEKKLKAKVDFEKPDVAILIDFNSGKASFNIRSIYVYGVYNKFSRSLPQTIYYCFACKGKGCKKCKETGKLSEESIQEILGKHFQEAFQARGNNFHGAGRESIDVKMLGNGREFVIELTEPKKRKLSQAKLKTLMQKVNKTNKSKLEISKLKMVSKEKVSEIKEAKHSKLYEAIIQCQKTVSEKDLKLLPGKYSVEQRFPERVEKKKKDFTRKKSAEILKTKKLAPKKFSIEIKTDSGLYVKEFISSDGGRTSPSISSKLKKQCECKELDVLKIYR